MSWVGRFRDSQPGYLPVALLGLALLLLLLSLNVPWFSVSTRIQAWNYDPNNAEGKGAYTGRSILVTTNMRPLSLETKIDPKEVQRVLEENGDLPSYGNEMDKAGSAMLGVFLLDLVVFVALAGAVGFYLLHQRGAKDYRTGIVRFVGLFAGFAVLALVYMAFAVPSAAQTDTREVLHSYASTFEGGSFPRIDPQMLNPNVAFWNKWVCCPPKSHFELNGQQYLVVVTTTSRPAAGFWLVGVDLFLAAAGFGLAQVSGQLGAGNRFETTSPAPPTKAT